MIQLSQRWLLAFSFASFTLVGEWFNLIAPYMLGKSAERAYFNLGSLMGVIFSLALLTCFFRFLDWARGRCHSHFIRFCIIATYVLVGIFPLNAIRYYGHVSSSFPLISLQFYKNYFPPMVLAVVAAGACLGLVLFLARHREKSFAVLDTVGVTLFPLALLMTYQLCVISFKTFTRPTTAKEFSVSSASAAEKRDRPRIIWILFDGFDYTLAFEKRPHWLKLPTWDKLRAESIDPINAQSPAIYTSRSIPSLFTGLEFEDQPEHQGRHLILYEKGSSERKDFSKLRNIFTESKAKRLFTGLVGWYLPYCFDLRVELDHCVYHSRSRFDYSGHPFTAAVQVLNRNFSPNGHRSVHQNAFSFSLEQSLRAIKKEDLDLVFLHEPIPHEPFIYDVQKEMLVLKHPRPEQGYYENLALTDKMLEQILEAIDKTKGADKTYLIVISDHPYEKFPTCDGNQNLRVPLFIRTPTRVGMKYTGKFDTIHTKKLINLIQDGVLQDTSDIHQWLTNFKP